MAEVTCHKCGYEWEYSGAQPVSSCPDCGVKTNTGVGAAADEGPDPAESDKARTTSVVCERCGYEWEYSGNLPQTTCPACERKTHTGLLPSQDDVPAGPMDIGSGIMREVDQEAGVLLYVGEGGHMCAVPIHETRLY